jgi:predicted dehydrogenase
MLEADVDLVIVATPMPLHVPQSVLALQAGKHVLSEVPAAVDLEQCWNLVQAVESSSARYMMGENVNFTKSNALVNAMVRQGLFGEVYYAEGQYIHELKNLNEETSWRRRWQTGRNGCTYSTHSLGPILQWMEDRVETVTCNGSGHHYRDWRGEPYEIEDSVTMACKLGRGGLSTIRLDMLSNRPSNTAYFALQGTEGCYEAPRGFGDGHKVWLKGRSNRENAWQSLWDYEADFLPEEWRDLSAEIRDSGHGGSDYLEVRRFVDAVLKDAPILLDVYAALDLTVPGLVSEHSINNGGIPVAVPDFRSIRRFPDDLPAELQNSPILSTGFQDT